MNNVRNFDQNVICYTNLANFDNFCKGQVDPAIICSISLSTYEREEFTCKIILFSANTTAETSQLEEAEEPAKKKKKKKNKVTQYPNYRTKRTTKIFVKAAYVVKM